MVSLYNIFHRSIFKKQTNYKNFQWLSLYIFNNIKLFTNCILLKPDAIHIFINKCYIYEVVQFFKINLFTLCNQLLDLTIIDKVEMPLKNKDRFEFIYMLISTVYNLRIFIRGFISLFDYLPSVSSLFNSANWLEREIWDMYGIFILNHPNLRRILTDYGFIGFPFRKDFPLSGYIELRYDEITKSVIIEPLELMQEFRLFKLEIPWKVL